jgi:iron complex outermembrane receptor protein
LARGALASLLILAGSSGKAAAEDWQAALDAAGSANSLDGWAGGFPAQTAQAETRFDFDIPAEALAVALTRFQQVTGLKIAADSKTIATAQTAGVRGAMTAREALAALLAGTGLGYRMADAQTVAIEPAAADAARKGPVVLNPLPVTAEGESETATGPVDGYVATRSATGTKTDTPIVETPQSISVITRDQLDTQNVERVAEALRYTAGAQSDIYGVDARGDWITIRGMEEGKYHDGLRTPDDGLLYGWWKVEPYGLERIEVMRGPSSVLYGQTSPGGLVNLVSKKPSDTPIHEVQLRSGSFWREELAADFSGPVTEDGDVLFRAVALGRYSQTQVEHTEDNRGYFAPSLTWRPSDDTTITFLTDFQEDRVGSSINFLPYEGTLKDNPHGKISTHTFTGEPDYDGHNERRFSLGYEFETKPTDQLTLRQNFRYGHLDLDYRTVYGAGLEADLRTLDRVTSLAFESTDAFAVDNQAEFKMGTGRVKNTVLGGVDFWDQQTDGKYGSAPGPSIDVFDPDYSADIEDPAIDTKTDQHARQIGLYLQDQLEIDRWRFLAGGRYDWARTATLDKIVGETVVQNDAAFTGRVGVLYLSEIGLAPYVSYATSFMPTGGTDAGGKPFEPETGDQYEVGVKFQPEGIKSSVTLSVFQLTRQNVLTTDPSDPTNSIQTGEVRNRGIELETQLSLADGLNVLAAYSFLDAKVTKTEDVTQGKRPGDVPRHSASLWADYTVPAGEFEGLGAGAGIRYTGSTLDFTNETRTPDHIVVDAAAHYTWDNLTFQLNVTNLLDNVYVNACDFYCYYGQRRTVTGTLKLSW